MLSRHEDICRIGADAETFSSDSGGGRQGGGTLIDDIPSGFAAGVLLNMMDDPRHQRIRMVVRPGVSPRALRTIELELCARAEAIVEPAVSNGECDFLVDVAAELPRMTRRATCGTPAPSTATARRAH
ncbi:MAG: hypothetical protein WHS89_11945 [Acidimicrobiales bacterium]